MAIAACSPTLAELRDLERREAPAPPGGVDEQRADELLLGEERHDQRRFGVEQAGEAGVARAAEAELAHRASVGSVRPRPGASRTRPAPPGAGPGGAVEPGARAEQVFALRVGAGHREVVAAAALELEQQAVRAPRHAGGVGGDLAVGELEIEALGDGPRYGIGGLQHGRGVPRLGGQRAAADREAHRLGHDLEELYFARRRAGRSTGGRARAGRRARAPPPGAPRPVAPSRGRPRRAGPPAGGRSR